MKNYDEKNERGYIFEVDVKYPEKLQEAYVKSFKQLLNHGLILKKVYRAISFNQSEWQKPYIDMNNELRQKGTNDFDKDFFKLMNNSVFRSSKIQRH